MASQHPLEGLPRAGSGVTSGTRVVDNAQLISGDV
ncbi:hypothetical protein SAMD00079811_38690 [Scytonema sp. HK-05]|nr:hypothetical protein SAMD00079811_38690 [Scytonema sp. HK-05]